VKLEGVGLHTGNRVSMTLLPAPPDHGIVFRRIDQHPPIDLAARVENVPDGHELGRNTTLGRGSVRVHTVEHVLAALSGLGIDNLRIDLDNNEPIEPADGSCNAFVDSVRATGTVQQGTPKRTFVVRQAVSLRSGDVELHALPYDGFRVSFTIRYDNPVIGTQQATFDLNPEVFAREIAPARTFALLRDVRALQARGLIRGGSLDNAIVVDEDRILNDGPLRFPDEFVRHKILDLLGDLALLGRPLQGHIISMRSGHDSNVQFVRALAASVPPERPPRSGIIWDIQDIQRIMPHRYPILLIDRIVEFEDRKRVVGIKNVTINEPFFAGHFPGHPIMPAVLILEAMAQCGGVLLLNSIEQAENKLMYFVGIDKARFRKPVLPGDQLRLELQLLRFGGTVCKMEGKAYVDGELVAEAELLSTVIER
jgi:UDP-3-O-[3-hydroxymyristoyl] N-acetylglucosamine deacetylase/3-hydroxyacyl-[acyl-carrier-protein] dehydratase